MDFSTFNGLVIAFITFLAIHLIMFSGRIMPNTEQF